MAIGGTGVRPEGGWSRSVKEEGLGLSSPCKRGPERRGTGSARVRTGWEPSCCPSFAVNPVFDPAGDSKEASASKGRPSVSGTRQSPPYSEAQDMLSLCGS